VSTTPKGLSTARRDVGEWLSFGQNELFVVAVAYIDYKLPVTLLNQTFTNIKRRDRWS